MMIKKILDLDELAEALVEKLKKEGVNNVSVRNTYYPGQEGRTIKIGPLPVLEIFKKGEGLYYRRAYVNGTFSRVKGYFKITDPFFKEQGIEQKERYVTNFTN